VTGFGVSQLQSLLDIRSYSLKYKIPVISDGGIRNSGDIVKALAAGANCVMIGKLFATCAESAASKKWEHGVRYANYRGQASFEYQKSGYTPEGVEMWTEVTGSIVDLLNNLLGGVRSGLTYGGSLNISEFQRKVIELDLMFEVNSSYLNESYPRN